MKRKLNIKEKERVGSDEEEKLLRVPSRRVEWNFGKNSLIYFRTGISSYFWPKPLSQLIALTPKQRTLIKFSLIIYIEFEIWRFLFSPGILKNCFIEASNISYRLSSQNNGFNHINHTLRFVLKLLIVNRKSNNCDNCLCIQMSQLMWILRVAKPFIDGFSDVEMVLRHKGYP